MLILHQDARTLLFVENYYTLKSMIMKRFILSVTFLALGLVWVSGIAPNVKLASYEGPMNEVVGQIKTVLEESAYEIIGQYQPGDNPDLYVLVFTSDELIAFCQQSKDRGMLAAAMKLGFQLTEGKITVSMVNPEYIFYAYFQEMMNDQSFNSSALELSAKVKGIIKGEDSKQEPFGGGHDAEKLVKYRYMAGMPKFSKSVSLAEFDSFDQGLAAIREGLSNGGNTPKVYEIVQIEEEIAVFGIGLKDKEKGEAHFLPIIGESHVAAMPYELILQGNEVTMLHGRFRFAVYWPELKMKTFTKIMSSPGDVEDAMKSLFETD
jgi:hypothetical protein